jgi:cellobiose transport system permease protein
MDQQREKRPAGAATRLWRASPLTYIALVVAVIISVLPLYYMVVGASRTNADLNKVPPPLTPGGNLWDNIVRVFANDEVNIGTGLKNSFIISACVTVSTVFFGSLAGFAFAKLKFRGKNALMLIILGTMMVPLQLGLIPLYLLTIKLGWHNEVQSVIVPFMISGFGVFLMRQYASQAVPDELIESARMDGCSTFRIYWNVVLPALRPAAAVLGLLTFMQTWNDLLWPLVSMQDPDQPTVQIALRHLSNGYYSDYSQIFAGTAVATIPLLIVFLVFGRQIIGGIMEGAVKA